jgi:ketosteroid isomerase-like protein
MSHENLEIHRRSVAAFNTRDVEEFIGFCDPRIELHSALTATVYHGHAGVRKWYANIEDAFGDELRLEPQAYFDLGERTVTFHLLHGRGRQSGAAVAAPFAHVHRWVDGLIVAFKAYADQGEALRELGVPEDTVPIEP